MNYFDLPIGYGIGRSEPYWKRMLSIHLHNLMRTTQVQPPPTILNEPDILEIEDVAKILRCSVDKVRRIPKTELVARTGPGKKLLYHRADIRNYFKNLPLAGNQSHNEKAATVSVLMSIKHDQRSTDIVLIE